MKAKQVSVFVENRPGRLMEVLQILETKSISIKGMSVGDAADIGIVRLIVSDPDRAFQELSESGFTARTDVVVCSEIRDVPGGLLHGVVEPISQSGINIQYFYAYTDSETDKVIAVIKVDDVDKAEHALA